MKSIAEKFIMDEKGHKTAAVIDIDKFYQLLEDFDDLRIIAERKKESSITLKDVEQRLKHNGLI